MQITRRGFLKGAAFSGAAAAAAAVGATMPGAALAAADEAVPTSSANPYLDLYNGGVSYLPVREVGEKPTFRNGKVAFEDREIGADEIRRVDSCDFLVIGAGICGIVGSLKAADEGAKVICVEKTSRGRSTWESMGGYGTKAQEASGNEVDPARFADAVLRASFFRALPEVVWSYINNSGAALDFVQDMLNESEYDIELYNTTQPETGYDLVTIQAEHKFKINGPVKWTAHMTGMFPMAALTSVANSRDNVDLRLYTAGVQLTQDEAGRVTGAIVKDEGGLLPDRRRQGRAPGDGRIPQQPGDDEGVAAPRGFRRPLSGGSLLRRHRRRPHDGSEGGREHGPHSSLRHDFQRRVP